MKRNTTFCLFVRKKQISFEGRSNGPSPFLSRAEFGLAIILNLAPKNLPPVTTLTPCSPLAVVARNVRWDINFLFNRVLYMYIYSSLRANTLSFQARLGILFIGLSFFLFSFFENSKTLKTYKEKAYFYLLFYFSHLMGKHFHH